MHKLNQVDLEKIVGGDYCSIFDVSCWSWGTLKQIGGIIKPGPTPPKTCIPRSAWNPVPPVPCS